ncbi:ATP-grasp domain-containing protein [Streptomyces sp. NPDC090029]|uniref:ATP-grasp domain-containing protein n=1 Tax=Streptomyces sp. NPDC090029 TaxID=3365924 RepID=UPI00381479F7
MSQDDKTAAPPHILVIGGGRDIPVRLRAAGARTTFLCRLEVLPSIREVEQATGAHGLARTSPVEHWTELALLLHARDAFTAVASFSEKDQDKAAHVAEALGLPWHSPETVRFVHDKLAMRERLRQTGVDPTHNTLANSVADVITFGNEHGWPVVVKPTQGTGSSGVTVVKGSAQAETAWAWAKDASWAENPQILVEEYLPGREVSVETVSEDGKHVPLAIVAKHAMPTHCVEVGHVVPAELSAESEARIHAFVRDLLMSLGVRHGVTHTELKLDSTAVRAVETHLRPAGDDIPSLVRDALGIDPINLLVEQTLGRPVLNGLQVVDTARGVGAGAAAVWYSLPASPGLVVDVKGLENARSVPNVVTVTPEIAPGDMVTEVRDSFSRTASVRAAAPTAARALAAAQHAASLIETVVEPVPEKTRD